MWLCVHLLFCSQCCYLAQHFLFLQVALVYLFALWKWHCTNLLFSENCLWPLGEKVERTWNRWTFFGGIFLVFLNIPRQHIHPNRESDHFSFFPFFPIFFLVWLSQHVKAMLMQISTVQSITQPLSLTDTDKFKMENELKLMCIPNWIYRMFVEFTS